MSPVGMLIGIGLGILAAYYWGKVLDGSQKNYMEKTLGIKKKPVKKKTKKKKRVNA